MSMAAALCWAGLAVAAATSAGASVPGNVLGDPGAEEAAPTWETAGGDRTPHGAPGLPSQTEAWQYGLGARAFASPVAAGSFTQTVAIAGPVSRLGFGGQFGGQPDAGSAASMRVELLDRDGLVVQTGSLAAGSHTTAPTARAGTLHHRSGVLYDAAASVQQARITLSLTAASAWADQLYLSADFAQIPTAPGASASVPPPGESPSPSPPSGGGSPSPSARPSALMRFGPRPTCGRHRTVRLLLNGNAGVAKAEVLHDGGRLARLTRSRPTGRILVTVRRRTVVLRFTKSDGTVLRVQQPLAGCRRPNRR